MLSFQQKNTQHVTSACNIVMDACRMCKQQQKLRSYKETPFEGLPSCKLSAWASSRPSASRTTVRNCSKQRRLLRRVMLEEQCAPKSNLGHSC